MLTGCDWFDDKAEVAPEHEAFLLTDRHPQNVKLQQQLANTLSNEQLYQRALSLWPVAYRELNVPTSLGQARIIVAGPVDAQPVVLLHGMHANSAMWYPNVATLAEQFRVYAVDDLLGSGGSQASADISDMSQLVRWYQELFEQLQLDSIHLVGASRGGWQAVAIALAESKIESSRIQRLVLLSPAQTFAWVEFSTDLIASIFFTLNPERAQVQDSLQSVSSRPELIHPVYLDQYVAALEHDPVPDLIMAMRPFSEQQLQQITVPTLVMIGDEDMMNDQDSLEQAKKLLPQAHTLQVKNAGHFLTVDQAELVNNEVVRFLSK